jgi:hypothetical protein
MDSGINDAYKQIVENEFPKFINFLERVMKLNHWGFKQTFYGVAQEFAPSIIYDLNGCRVRFLWYPADPRDGYPTLGIKYGRAHASDNERFIMWNGELCHCWHRVDLVLHYLDGLSPKEAAEKRFEVPPVKDQFIQLNKDHTWSSIEWTARQEVFVWEHYEHRLFDLFDLHHPNLWKQYTLFIRDLFKLIPQNYKLSSPPPENIC